MVAPLQEALQVAGAAGPRHLEALSVQETGHGAALAPGATGRNSSRWLRVHVAQFEEEILANLPALGLHLQGFKPIGASYEE